MSKIYPDHYATMKLAITTISKDVPLIKAKLRNDPRVLQRQFGSVEKLLRYDILHFAGLSRFVQKELYMYLEPREIDDAVKRILKELYVC